MPINISQTPDASQGDLVTRFLQMDREMDEAEAHLRRVQGEKTNDPQAVDAADANVRAVRSRLQAFIGECSAEDRKQLETFFLKQQAFQNVENARALARSKITRVLNWLPQAVGAAAEPVARLSGETIRLITTTLGHSARGLYTGAKSTVDAFRTAA